jgi:hypothetical protein
MHFFNLDLCQVPYLFFSASLGTFSYNTQEAAGSPVLASDHVNALLSFDGVNKRLYLYTTVPQGITSYNLDGSDSTTIPIQNVELFTVDGKNNLIYYLHLLRDRIYVYNITSGEDSAVTALSDVTNIKDVEMEVTNG